MSNRVLLEKIEKLNLLQDFFNQIFPQDNFKSPEKNLNEDKVQE